MKKFYAELAVGAIVAAAGAAVVEATLASWDPLATTDYSQTAAGACRLKGTDPWAWELALTLLGAALPSAPGPVTLLLALLDCYSSPNYHSLPFPAVDPVLDWALPECGDEATMTTCSGAWPATLPV